MTKLIPAYGRDYKSKKALLADWQAGKDFLICDHFNRWDGKPVNREQITGPIQFRYGNLRKTFVLNPR